MIEAAPAGRAIYVSAITKAWQEIATEIIEIGKCLIRAKAELPHGDFETMVEKELPFGPRTAQRLMAIASSKLLSNPTHASLLPASWMTLYELTRLPEAVLVNALIDGTITPSTERKDVAKLRQANAPTSRITIATTNTVSESLDPRAEWEAGVVVGAEAALNAIHEHRDHRGLTVLIINHVSAELYASPNLKRLTAELRSYATHCVGKFAPTDLRPAPEVRLAEREREEVGTEAVTP